MIYYRDRTYCGSKVAEHTCGAEFTEQDAIDAEKWWGNKDYPVAYSDYCAASVADTTPTNTTESLDEIFNLVRMSHELMLGAPTVEDYKHSQELLSAAKQAIQQEVLRVIGDDEACNTGTAFDCGNLLGGCDHIPKNELRAEQRKRLNTLLGGESNE